MSFIYPTTISMPRRDTAGRGGNPQLHSQLASCCHLAEPALGEVVVPVRHLPSLLKLPSLPAIHLERRIRGKLEKEILRRFGPETHGERKTNRQKQTKQREINKDNTIAAI